MQCSNSLLSLHTQSYICMKLIFYIIQSLTIWDYQVWYITDVHQAILDNYLRISLFVDLCSNYQVLWLIIIHSVFVSFSLLKILTVKSDRKLIQETYFNFLSFITWLESSLEDSHINFLINYELPTLERYYTILHLLLVMLIAID